MRHNRYNICLRKGYTLGAKNQLLLANFTSTIPCPTLGYHRNGDAKSYVGEDFFRAGFRSQGKPKVDVR